MALATTFDPQVLRRLGTIGVAADAALARQWYAKAAALGSSAATQSLAQLDAAGLPLVTEAARLTQGVDDGSRFLFGLDALLHGFAQRPVTSGPTTSGCG